MPVVLATRNGLYVASDAGELAPRVEGDDFMALARAGGSGAALYAASRGGRVFRSTDGAASWHPVGALEGFEELSSLAVHPGDPGRLLAGMEPSALFQSEDGGATWREDPAIRRMSGEQGWSVPWSDAEGHIRGIAVDAADPRRIYLAIEVGGVVRTEDGGRTWENVHGGIHDDVHSVAVGPGSVVYAATRHGFGRSEDRGRTWRQINEFGGQGYSRPLAVDPSDPERLYTTAATTGPGGFSRPDVGAECGVFRSEDGGRSWMHLTEGIPARFRPYVDALDVDPGRPERVVLADSQGSVYHSLDRGRSWSSLCQAPPTRRLMVV